MVIGFNNQDPYIATAMNSETHEDRYPIIHAALQRTYEGDSLKFYLTFVELARDENKSKVKEFKQELMKFIAENCNLKLPYLIEGKYYKFSNTEIIPGRKYSLLPEIQ